MKLEAGILIAGRNRAPLFQPRPEPLHVIAIVVDPLRTGRRGFVLLGRDRRTRTQVPTCSRKALRLLKPRSAAAGWARRPGAAGAGPASGRLWGYGLEPG